ncbi:uncharacterized protein LOC129765095 [Toxorhynchites rutilus septentrionalis]|uniref:uncharacterized protein LOC129765095 n=1 Tax=Toxorhynchites rutilus septentrionalis TaxID=329112 RepID=UPI00247A8FF4|nr:uncharacterized protein LOC129765095 [Toxorhynchites rutilus septentrionalis]
MATPTDKNYTICSVCKNEVLPEMWQICLVCEDYDICRNCFLNKRYSEHHRFYHPIQLIPSSIDLKDMNYLSCPYCCDSTFNVVELAKHCQQFHVEGGHKVRCPICVVRRTLNHQDLFEVPLLEHLMSDHEEIFVETPFDDECPICLDRLTSDLFTLRCGHVFHNDCIRIWLQHVNTCPMCRATY